MKVWIVHNSKHGNGKLMAQKIAEALEPAEVKIGHIKKVSPKEVVEDEPDLIIIGAAVRVFRIWGKSKKWIKKLNNELEKEKKTIKYGFCYITHMMSKEKTEGKALDIVRLMMNSSIEQVYPEWLSGQVKEIEGPLKEGITEEIVKKSGELMQWIDELENSKSVARSYTLPLMLYEHISFLALL
ncbi:MAG: flavodoxin domain-containing protein [Candidatus Kariarchaeaceae archaeon]